MFSKGAMVAATATSALCIRRHNRPSLHNITLSPSSFNRLNTSQVASLKPGALRVSSSRPISAMANAAGNGSGKAAAPVQSDAEELINSVETFIFDCDGVIWKGDSLIAGVPETLDMLRSKGKRLVFVTNNSTKSRKQYGKKFETLGLTVGEEEIFASSFAAAAYLKSIDFPQDKKCVSINFVGAGFSHGFRLVRVDLPHVPRWSQMLTARLARRSTHFMKIINVEDSRVLPGVFKHQHLFSCKRNLRTPARVIM